jgi:hypothetical protein
VGLAFRHVGWIVALLVLGASIAFVQLTRMQPEYDAYGWLDWGRQALHFDLNTNGAPSWKPLTFLFTFPYALAGGAQAWLWMVTSVAAAFAGAVFAARLAHRLTGPGPTWSYPRLVAAGFAGVGMLGISGFWPLVLIASSDPMVVSLCLGAIDSHLSGRPRVAFGLLVLAALGRPEAWPFVALYARWAWRAVPGMRPLVAGGLAAIPALWFGVSALTAKTWLRAGDVALNTATTLRHNVIGGVLDRFRGQYELPMQVAAAIGIGFAALRRHRTILLLAAAGLLWVIVEIAFAFHGWPAEARYMAEPAAIGVIIAGTAVGRALEGLRTNQPWLGAATRLAGAAATIVLLVALAPVARQRASVLQAEVNQRRDAGLEIGRLANVITRDGGADHILDCGTAVSVVGFQSTLAYDLGLNVGYVGYKPSHAIHKGYPIVLFKPHDLGWQVLPIHIRGPDRVQCDRLKTATTFGAAPGGAAPRYGRQPELNPA